MSVSHLIHSKGQPIGKSVLVIFQKNPIVVRTRGSLPSAMCTVGHTRSLFVSTRTESVRIRSNPMQNKQLGNQWFHPADAASA